MSELAKTAGLSYFYLSKVERGYCNPGPRIKHAISVVLGLDEKELFPEGPADETS